MEYFLLSVLGALAYNWPLLILGIVAAVKASNGKSFSGWLIAGCIVQVVPLSGGYRLAFQSGSTAIAKERFFYELIVFLVLLFVFSLWASIEKKKALKKKASAADNSSIPEEIRQEVANRKYICDSCGFYSSGWYQKCPKCGAAGTMKRSDVTEQTVLSEKRNAALNGIKTSESMASNHKTDNEAGVDKDTMSISISTLPAKLRRAFIFIEDEDWDRADEYLEKVLDEEPENAYAYLGKALIDIKVNSLEHLTSDDIAALSENRNFKRAKKYANEELRDQMDLW